MKWFEEVDPYNKENTIEGIYYGEGDGAKYGCIEIKRINGKETYQYIHGTPKFEYPGTSRIFDKFPKGWEYVTVYDKIDGTNILQYNYYIEDENNQKTRFKSYKTRLTPFLKENGFKNWIQLWGKMLEKYPQIKNLPNDRNFAFELYGSINEILIKYKIDLDCVLIYSIDEIGSLHEPESSFGIPIPKVVNKLQNISDEELKNEYLYLREKMEKKFVDDEDVEGAVFYFSYKNESKALKCKPPSVLNLQIESESENKIKCIGWRDVRTTIQIVLENFDDFENFTKLKEEIYESLKTEYTDKMIENSKRTIEYEIEDTLTMIKRRRRVKEIYEEMKTKGFNFNKDHAAVMREIMKNFNKKDSSMIYKDLKTITF